MIGQRDQGHHARLAVAQLRHGHLQEGQAAVEEDDDRERPARSSGCPGTPGMLKPSHRCSIGLKSSTGTVSSETDPEALAEHLLVTRVVHVAAVAMAIGAATLVRLWPTVSLSCVCMRAPAVVVPGVFVLIVVL